MPSTMLKPTRPLHCGIIWLWSISLAACEGGGAEGRSRTCRGQENCQKVMVAMLKPLLSKIW